MSAPVYAVLLARIDQLVLVAAVFSAQCAMLLVMRSLALVAEVN